MKKLSLLSTSLLMYLTELPIIYLLYIAIKYNANVEGAFKLYPLIIALIGIAIFIFIYLFRVVIISYDMIKSVGPFSSKEKALIVEGKTLILTIVKHRKTKVELFGVDEQPPMLDWAIDKDYTAIEVNLYRDRVPGGYRAVKKILKYFEVLPEDVDLIVSSSSFEKSYEFFDIHTKECDDLKEIKIKFTKTV